MEDRTGKKPKHGKEVDSGIPEEEFFLEGVCCKYYPLPDVLKGFNGHVNPVQYRATFWEAMKAHWDEGMDPGSVQVPSCVEPGMARYVDQSHALLVSAP